MSKHNLKHHPLGKITICGIFIADRNILAQFSDDVTCKRCASGLDNAQKCAGYFDLPNRAAIEQQQKERRADERAAHLALRAQVKVGLSWQEARALVRGMRRGFTPRGGCLEK